MSHPQAKLPGHQHSPPASTHHNASDARHTHNHSGQRHIYDIPDEALLEIFKLLPLKDVPALALSSWKFHGLTQHTLEAVLEDLLGSNETITPSLMSFLVLGATQTVERYISHAPFQHALHFAACRMTKMYISLEYASEHESKALLGLLGSFLNFSFPSVVV